MLQCLESDMATLQFKIQTDLEVACPVELWDFRLTTGASLVGHTTCMTSKALKYLLQHSTLSSCCVFFCGRE